MTKAMRHLYACNRSCLTDNWSSFPLKAWIDFNKNIDKKFAQNTQVKLPGKAENMQSWETERWLHQELGLYDLVHLSLWHILWKRHQTTGQHSTPALEILFLYSLWYIHVLRYNCPDWTVSYPQTCSSPVILPTSKQAHSACVGTIFCLFPHHLRNKHLHTHWWRAAAAVLASLHWQGTVRACVCVCVTQEPYVSVGSLSLNDWLESRNNLIWVFNRLALYWGGSRQGGAVSLKPNGRSEFTNTQACTKTHTRTHKCIIYVSFVGQGTATCNSSPQNYYHYDYYSTS